ncbi:MAG: VWA domain-containing protein, partial [Chloroflexi bacterium]|nr:VWA domain-containing protein [Chloroflexota bacterium]
MGYADGIELGTPDVYTFDGCTITVAKTSGGEASEVAYIDLVLLLDVSGSVDAAELVYLKLAANAIVDAFNLEIADGRMRIGIVRFRGSAVSVVDMTDVDVHNSSEPLHNGINGMVQGAPDLDAGTDIVAGLNAAGAQFDTGLGDRVDPPYPVPNLVVVITDGDDTAGNGNAAINAASDAAAYKVFAIGVGDDIGSGTINAIASEATSRYSFNTSSYSGLMAIVNEVFTSVNLDAGMGTLFTIESVSADGTVSISEVVFPPE